MSYDFFQGAKTPMNLIQIDVLSVHKTLFLTHSTGQINGNVFEMEDHFPESLGIGWEKIKLSFGMNRTARNKCKSF